jgi:hypothetical protein
MLPAGHMKRYKNLHVEDETKIKIFGKLKAHQLGNLLAAGAKCYPSKKLAN